MAPHEYYLWSDVVTNVQTYENGQFKSMDTKKVGEKVTQSDLGASDEDWEYYVSEGVVRTEPYPETRTGESPKQALLRGAKEAMDRAELGLAPVAKKAESKNDGTVKATDKTGS